MLKRKERVIEDLIWKEIKIEKKRENKRNEWKIHQKKMIEKMEIEENLREGF